MLLQILHGLAIGAVIVLLLRAVGGFLGFIVSPLQQPLHPESYDDDEALSSRDGPQNIEEEWKEQERWMLEKSARQIAQRSAGS